MATSHFTHLSDRAVVKVSGEDRASFLQGLISNDIGKVQKGRGIWAGFLTPQGKFLYDLFITPHGDDYLIDVEAARTDAFVKKLSMFKLKAKVAIVRVPELSVFAAWGTGVAGALGLAADAGNAIEIGAGTAMIDPRLPDIGARLLAPDASVLTAAGVTDGAFADWDGLRIGLGLPDGSRDLTVESTLLLEAGFDELGGVDFQKGCYMGQETTARSKYRGLIKKRLIPVSFDGPVPAPGTPVVAAGAEAGEVRSTQGAQGLALIRLEALSGDAVLMSGETKLTPHKPTWAVFPPVG